MTQPDAERAVLTPQSIAELAQIASDVYLFRYARHVAMFITTTEGVILVDPIGQGNPHTPSLIKAAIGAVTDAPVRYLLYSHWGADHGIGGAVFADTAQFVGQRNVAPKIAAANDPTSPVPQILFDDYMGLDLGGKRIDLYAADLSDGDDYFILHYPARRLIMTVDYVQPRNVPFRTLLGHPDRIVERLQWIHESLGFDVLVSGHDSPHMTGVPSDVVEQRQYYLDLSDAIVAAQAGGAEANSERMVEGVRAALAPKYGSWRRFDEFLALNVQGMLAWRNLSS